jgi:hypothetical protein
VFSAGPLGALIQAPDGSVGRTCQKTAGAGREGKPACATTPRSIERDIHRAREKGDAARSQYATANEDRPEIFLRLSNCNALHIDMYEPEPLYAQGDQVLTPIRRKRTEFLR